MPAQYDMSGDVIEAVRLMLAKRAAYELGTFAPFGGRPSLRAVPLGREAGLSKVGISDTACVSGRGGFKANR